MCVAVHHKNRLAAVVWNQQEPHIDLSWCLRIWQACPVCLLCDWHPISIISGTAILSVWESAWWLPWRIQYVSDLWTRGWGGSCIIWWCVICFSVMLFQRAACTALGCPLLVEMKNALNTKRTIALSAYSWCKHIGQESRCLMNSWWSSVLPFCSEINMNELH